MNFRPADLRRLLVICADTLAWAESAELRADYRKLWSKHDSLLARLEPPRRGGGKIVDRLRQLEIALWSEVALASLETNTINRLAASLAPGAGGVWGDIAREAEEGRIDQHVPRARSAAAAFDAALLRFLTWPSENRVREAFESLDALVDIAAPRRPACSATELKAGVDRLVETLPSVLAPDAAAFLGSIVAERFSAEVDEAWLAQVPTVPRKRWERAWTPSWERLEQVTAPVEPPTVWFTPELQGRYEEMRLAREIERSHTEALAEDGRRSDELADQELRGTQIESLERDLALARRRLEQWDLDAPRRRAGSSAEADLVAGEIAESELKQEFQARGVRWKAIERTDRLYHLEKRTAIVRARFAEDRKGQEETGTAALLQRVRDLEVRLAESISVSRLVPL